MNILITGGTGSIGTRLALRLSRSGDRIFVLDKAKRQNDGNQGIFYIESDLFSEQKDISGIDVVYHLAANLDESDPNMYEQNISMTKNISEMCKNSGVKQIIFMSSSGVLGETTEPSTEDMEYNPDTSYEKSKMESENIIKDCGVPYTIIRASVIIAPNKIWQFIIGAAKKGFPIIGSGENKFHLSYIDDVVELLLLVKNNQKAKNEIFHTATKDIPSYRDVYKMICQELGCEMTTKSKNPFLIKFALNFKKHPVLNKHTVDRLLRNRQMNIEKAEKVLGFVPKNNTKQALHKTIKYLKLIRLGYSDSEIAEMNMLK